MASIIPYQAKNGKTTYTIKFYKGVNPYTNKKENYIKRGFKTKKEAELALAKAQIDFAEKGFQSNEIIEDDIFLNIYKVWFSSYQNTVKITTSIETERLFKNHILPKFGTKKINAIKPIFCQQIVNEWVGCYVHAKKLKQYTQKIFEYAIDMEILEKNPMARVKFNKHCKKMGKQKIAENYNAEILKQYLDSAKHFTNYQDFVLIHLLAFTGARKGEILALNWDNINFNDGSIRIVNNLVRGKGEIVLTTPKTDTSIRKIYLDDETMAILKKWKQLQHNTHSQLKAFKKAHLVFSRIDDNGNIVFSSPEYPNRLINTLIQKYNLPKLTPHDFRYIHASILLEQKVKPKAVSERLGHSDIQTTLGIYTHIPNKQAKNVATDFFKLLS
ncbi:MAG: site-specific integrase [Streptococcaceae bacterium]|jgi:integrase|nr:site-specific integrase [Streptococcaceae bacterium]